MTCGDFSSKYFKKFPSNISSKLFFELYSSQYFSSEYFSSEYFSSEYYSSEYYSSEYCSKRVGENIVFVNFLWSAAHVSHTTVTDFRPKLALDAPTWHLLLETFLHISWKYFSFSFCSGNVQLHQIWARRWSGDQERHLRSRLEHDQRQGVNNVTIHHMISDQCQGVNCCYSSYYFLIFSKLHIPYPHIHNLFQVFAILWLWHCILIFAGLNR